MVLEVQENDPPVGATRRAFGDVHYRQRYEYYYFVNQLNYTKCESIESHCIRDLAKLKSGAPNCTNYSCCSCKHKGKRGFVFLKKMIN